MSTDLITIEVPLVPVQQLHALIDRELRQFGEPLRWAITQIHAQTVEIEAVVTRE